MCRPSLALARAGPRLVQTLPIQMPKNLGACASIPSTKRPPTRARPFDPNKQCQGRYHLRAVKQARRHQVAMRPVRRDAPRKVGALRRAPTRRIPLGNCSVGSEHCHVDCTPGKGRRIWARGLRISHHTFGVTRNTKPSRRSSSTTSSRVPGNPAASALSKHNYQDLPRDHRAMKKQGTTSPPASALRAPPLSR